MKAEDYLDRLKNLGRNDQCPCGSGKKYKKCHLAQDEELQQKELEKMKELAAIKDKEDRESNKVGSNVPHFTDEPRPRIKPQQAVTRSNALRRQAGK
jgi:hypothetical protein